MEEMKVGRVACHCERGEGYGCLFDAKRWIIYLVQTMPTASCSEKKPGMDGDWAGRSHQEKHSVKKVDCVKKRSGVGLTDVMLLASCRGLLQLQPG